MQSKDVLRCHVDDSCTSVFSRSREKALRSTRLDWLYDMFIADGSLDELSYVLPQDGEWDIIQGHNSFLLSGGSPLVFPCYGKRRLLRTSLAEVTAINPPDVVDCLLARPLRVLMELPRRSCQAEFGPYGQRRGLSSPHTKVFHCFKP